MLFYKFHTEQCAILTTPATGTTIEQIVTYSYFIGLSSIRNGDLHFTLILTVGLLWKRRGLKLCSRLSYNLWDISVIWSGTIRYLKLADNQKCIYTVTKVFYNVNKFVTHIRFIWIEYEPGKMCRYYNISYFIYLKHWAIE